jgi:hypothetical protein
MQVVGVMTDLVNFEMLQKVVVSVEELAAIGIFAFVGYP